MGADAIPGVVVEIRYQPMRQIDASAKKKISANTNKNKTRKGGDIINWYILSKLNGSYSFQKKN